MAAVLDGGIRLTPFQTERNMFHQATSALASALRDTWWSSEDTVVDALMRFLINARPGCTILEAWWSRPIKDNNSLLVPVLLGAESLLDCIHDWDLQVPEFVSREAELARPCIDFYR